jgi:hypothetical protein
MTATMLDQLDGDWSAAFGAAFEAAHEPRLLADLRDERLQTAAALERLAHACGAPTWSSRLARADNAGRGGSTSGAAT